MGAAVTRPTTYTTFRNCSLKLDFQVHNIEKVVAVVSAWQQKTAKTPLPRPISTATRCLRRAYAVNMTNADVSGAVRACAHAREGIRL